MTSTDLAEIVENLESQKDSYTIGNSDGHVSVVAQAFGKGHEHLIRGSTRVMELLKEIEKELPPFRINFTPHDGPGKLTDYEVKNALLNAARLGECKLFQKHSFFFGDFEN